MNTRYRFVRESGGEVIIPSNETAPARVRIGAVELDGATVVHTLIVPDWVGVPVTETRPDEVATPGWPTPGTPQHELANLIWIASRSDEGTISATGANHVAQAVLANRQVWDTDADLEKAVAAWGGRTGAIPEGGSGQVTPDRVENIALTAEAQGNYLSAIALRYMVARMRRMTR